MFEQQPIRKEDLAIALIWLFHVSGMIGILYGNSRWFVSATPLNLSLSFGLLLYTSRRQPRVYIVAICAFLLGLIAEAIGVNFGYIFGHYAYGEALGPKIAGVPWLIGINWAVLTICCGAIATHMVNAFLPRLLLGVGLMLFLDVVIEPIAPILDFWEFSGGEAPMQNYYGWFIIALPLQFLYQQLKITLEETFTHHLYLLQLLFFTVLLLQINTLQNAL